MKRLAFDRDSLTRPTRSKALAAELKSVPDTRRKTGGLQHDRTKTRKHEPSAIGHMIWDFAEETAHPSAAADTQAPNSKHV